ncbi:MAG: CHAT domain-containing protein [Verrucomicrobia bacterium]|nr:CHAT domain-containing protein [Verrucomicrobiota bacterium]
MRRFKMTLGPLFCVFAISACLVEVSAQTGSQQMPAVQDRDSAASRSAELMKEVTQLFTNKEHEKALLLLDECLVLKETAFGSNSLQVADILFIKGGISRQQGRFSDALPPLQRCLAIEEKLLGKDHPELINVLLVLGLTCKSQGASAPAIDYFERCLSIQEQHPKERRLNVDSLLQNLANLYRTQDDYRRGLSVLERCQKIQEASFGSNSLQVANCLHKQGLIHQDRGDYIRAMDLFKRGLDMRLAVAKEDDDFAICLRDIAVSFRKQGSPAQALPLYLRAVETLDKIKAPDSDKVAGVLGSFASYYQEQGEFENASALYDRCRELMEKKHGADHPSLAALLGSLANLKEALGHYEESLALHKRSLAMTEQAVGTENREYAVGLGNLGEFLLNRGDTAQALHLCQRSLDILEKLLGTNHTDVASAICRLASVEVELGNRAEALSLLRRSLAIREGVLGTQSLDTAYSLNSLASLLGILGDNSTALELYTESLAIIEKVQGAESPGAAAVLENLAVTHKEIGQTRESLALYSRSLAIKQKIYGAEHLEIAGLLANLADLRRIQGEATEAETLYRQSLAMKTKFLGPDHPEVAIALNNLASIYHSSGRTAESISGFSRSSALLRAYLVGQFTRLSGNDALRLFQLALYQAAVTQSACAEAPAQNATAAVAGAEQIAVWKALLEEVQATQAAVEVDQRAATQRLREQLLTTQHQLARLPDEKLEPPQRDARRRELQKELNELEAKLQHSSTRVADSVRERSPSLVDFARNVPNDAVLLDFVEFRRFDFAAKTNAWKEQRFAAYLTFPLAKDSTNLLVERVDLGEAAPINEAVEVLCRRLGAGQYRARDVEPALQRLNARVYSPLARHLTNVAHLIVCPDGPLSRVPFEMLPVPSGGTNRWLVEEKTISYVSSGREVARIAARAASPRSKVQSPRSVVFGNPDFDLKLPDGVLEKGSNGVLLAAAPSQHSTSPSLPHSAALSRSFTGFKFAPLPGAGKEAQAVAGLLGKDCALRLGAQAREAELKKVVSPRVLHIATHGFFLSDQEWNHEILETHEKKHGVSTTGLGVGSSWPGSFGAGPLSSGSSDSRFKDWENPLIRCGLALAGANHFTNADFGMRNAEGEDGILTGLEASLLNLQGTELVILSACQSGAGEVKIGEGVMSLRRAFTIAGAESVLASHWKVSDAATSRLMTEFMRRWRAGTPRAQAWREAQLSLLQSGGEWSHPYFWAAFTLTGKWR